jgi:hypothetical protein
VPDFEARVAASPSSVMESQPSPAAPPPAAEPTVTVAEDLPELYRAILDRVDHLERIGERREAGEIRVAATGAYSVAWDEAARVRLTALVVRADRALAGPSTGRGWSLRRRRAEPR